MLALRWLAFFVLADLITALAVPTVVLPFSHMVIFLGAVREGLFSPTYERYGLEVVWVIYTFRIEHMPGFVSLFFTGAVLPGLLIAFWMARESLDHTGWRFWTWRGE